MESFLLLPRIAGSTSYDVCFALVIGVLVCWLLYGKRESRPGRYVLVLSAWVLPLSLISQLWLNSAVMVNSSKLSSVNPAIPIVLSSTHSGQVWKMEFYMALLCALLVTGLLVLRRRTSSMSTAIIFTFYCVLCAVRAATGHSADDGDFSRAEAVQWVHLLATAIWAGSVLVSGTLVVPWLVKGQQPARVSGYGRRLSNTAAIAVLAVAASGAYNSWNGLGHSLPPLWTSTWGRILLLKLVLITLALLLGLRHKAMLRTHPEWPQVRAHQFCSTLRVEALVMLAILLVSGWLANSPPAVS